MIKKFKKYFLTCDIENLNKHLKFLFVFKLTISNFQLIKNN